MLTLVVVGIAEDNEECGEGETKASDSSRTVGDIVWARDLRVEDIEEDIRRSMRLARLDFLSFSSLVEDEEPAVGGGEKSAWRSSGSELSAVRNLGCKFEASWSC